MLKKRVRRQVVVLLTRRGVFNCKDTTPEELKRRKVIVERILDRGGSIANYLPEVH